MSWFDDLLNDSTANKLLNLGISTGVEYFGLNDPKGIEKQGYQEPVPEYDFVQERVPGTYDPNRRPGSAGQRYFTQGRYVPRDSDVGTQYRQFLPQELTATGLASLNQSNPARQARAYGSAPRMENMKGIGQAPYIPVKPPYMPSPQLPRNPPSKVGDGEMGEVERWIENEKMMNMPPMPINPPPYVNFNVPGNPPGGVQQPGFISKGYARGGVAALERDKYIAGTTDGMADEVPAKIDGVQDAALSDGEFVVASDVVSHLGNGNSEAGAKVLYDMMERIRKARTGTKKQGKKINPRKMLPA